MAMLYMTGPFPATELDTWIRQDSKGYGTTRQPSRPAADVLCRDKDKAISVLESLHIVTQAQETSGSRAYRLSSGFQNSLRQALTGGGNHRSFGVPCVESDLKKVSIDRLDLFARGQWEAILHYMVGSAGSTLGGGAEISPGTKTLLDLGHFIESRGGRATITQAGFSFLLQEVNAQVWSLLIVYLENAHKVRVPICKRWGALC